MSTRPHGTWQSPYSASMVAAQGVRLGSVGVDRGCVYWLEGRPEEGGRHALVRRELDGRIADVGPPGFNARTRAHEYGGGAYIAAAGEIYASSFADQRLYRLWPDAARPPVPVTPAGPWRYADGVLDLGRRRLIAVREDHSDPSREAVNTLVSIPLDGRESAGDVIASGYDFYSTPRLSPGGRRLCWLAWRHPQMPWDGTELWAGDVGDDGRLGATRLVAGGDAESVYQPGWLPDGELLFVSDRDGWWRVYRAGHGGDGPIRAVLHQPPARTEFGRPQWTFGTATWAPAGPGRLVVAYTRDGRWRLGGIDVDAGGLTDLAIDVEPGDSLASDGDAAYLVASSATAAPAVVRIDLRSGVSEVLRPSSPVTLHLSDVSVPQAIEFASDTGERVHAFYYPPTNADVTGPTDERPPLIVVGHGGPTSAASATLDLRVQFWTSRGFAVVDVNYGGSSGFGRAYRERLHGEWGLVDVADLAAAARAVVAAGNADPRKVIVRGGSAGGFTTLAALIWRADIFMAGASYYGISDLEALQLDTHKFEARYSERLIAPYPSGRAVYRARSPLLHVDHLSRPLILFQGLDDKVVPPNQSETMAAAVRAKGLPVAYLAFDGEQHGFRKAETIVTSLLAELGFYGRVFGFTPADEIPSFTIDNL